MVLTPGVERVKLLAAIAACLLAMSAAIAWAITARLATCVALAILAIMVGLFPVDAWHKVKRLATTAMALPTVLLWVPSVAATILIVRQEPCAVARVAVDRDNGAGSS